MVARAAVGIPALLCLWISEIIASVPGRCAVTVLELLAGTMLTGSGSISQAILAVPCRRHGTSYYWIPEPRVSSVAGGRHSLAKVRSNRSERL
jgi:hypothetical protein